MLRLALTSSLALLALSTQAADPSSLPAGPAPVGNAAYGVTPTTAKPLADKAGFVSWKTLTQVEAIKQGDTMVPKFDPAIVQLDKKVVRLQGFMLPLGMSEKQTHFILTATPPSCAFCLPGGPDQVIEVKASKPVKFVYDTISLSGKLELLKSDPMGLYYRLSNATQID
ncbi:DUF3299 domain-containing protein [Chitinimonas sp. BJYL2]|uniref:DUF3299 domain-containing protein n=1 Tax=Chitinimonas sp. BJYL2 TaxID=2976696 RepID=UPI0022B3A31F|nr:DUF3299 domain-containing protein [Chitinimonas sp. BJYL2]